MIGLITVLKGGVIYDIKRVTKYAPQKYLKSYQHPAYFELFPIAKQFTYLVYDDTEKLHTETYYKDECVNIEGVIADFIRWLKENDLFDVFVSKWKAN